MRVALHNGDGTGAKFPNLALMKLSAWHKARGDSAEWFDALAHSSSPYDSIYTSKVFTFTPIDPYLPKDAILGGTGYGLLGTLPPGIESCQPDYSLYPDFKHALGFITRGCARFCPWCIVPAKEGWVHFDSPIERFLQNRKSAFLMDNNFLSYENHMSELQNLISLGIRIDFNQGLDARLITEGNAALLAKVKWIRCIRISCDTPEMRGKVRDALALLRRHGYSGEVFCYVLVNDVTEAHETVEQLRGLNVFPFAQAYIDYTGEDRRTREQKDFCRWVNRKAIFKTVQWKDYKKRQSPRKSGSLLLDDYLTFI